MYLSVPECLCLNPRAAQHLQELLLRERLNPQGLRFGQLTAGVLTYNQVIRLLADGAGRPGAKAQQFHLDPVTSIILQFAGGHNGLAGKGIVLYFMHDIFLLHKCDVGECGPPEFGFLCIVVPVVDIVVHHLTEIFQLGKVKMLQDGLLERFPGATELLVENTAGMTPHLRDAQGGNELVERT